MPRTQVKILDISYKSINLALPQLQALKILLLGQGKVRLRGW
jgi:hypothetical protein